MDVIKPPKSKVQHLNTYFNSLLKYGRGIIKTYILFNFFEMKLMRVNYFTSVLYKNIYYQVIPSIDLISFYVQGF